GRGDGFQIRRAHFFAVDASGRAFGPVQAPARAGTGSVRVGVVASGCPPCRVVRGPPSASPPVRSPAVRVADRVPVLIMLTRITGIIPEPQLIRITRFACRDMD